MKLQQKLAHGLITLSGLEKEEILQLLQHAKKFKDGYTSNSLAGRMVASLFFEASTRTRLSFESAIQRLGGQVIGFSEPSNTSLGSKNESIADTLKMLEAYSDVIVMRHPNDGASALAQELLTTPIINAGDGGNLHPTQTLLDLFAIYETQGTLESINLALMGDLKYSRTIKSLVQMAVLFNMRLYFISSEAFRPPQQLIDMLDDHGVAYSFHEALSDIVSELDILYMTRLQKERFLDQHTNTKNFIVTPEQLATAKDTLKILHPLPRNEEIPTDIDSTPYAYYFEQAQNGPFVRMALLDLVISGNKTHTTTPLDASETTDIGKPCPNVRCISHIHTPKFIVHSSTATCKYCETARPLSDS